MRKGHRGRPGPAAASLVEHHRELDLTSIPCVHMHMEVRVQTWVLFLSLSTLLVDTESLTCDLSSPNS